MRTMEEDHRRDYADLRRIDDLRRTLREFVNDPPGRASRSVPAVVAALELLTEDSERIQRVWD